MPYAVNLTLDQAAAFAIERVYAWLETLGVGGDLVTQYGPCVTLLVVSDQVAPAIMTKILGWKLPAMSSVAVSLTEPCVILGTPPTLSLRVSPSAGLLHAHDLIYRELPEAEVHFHYRPAYWQPHVKLANVQGGEQAGAALIAQLGAEWQAVPGVLGGLEVMRYPPVRSIWQAPLRAVAAERDG